MRALICDDDPLFRELLTSYLTEYFEKKSLTQYSIAAFASGEELLHDNAQQDIIFLDIEMPGINGIFVGNELKKRNNAPIIFVVTSYSEYLDEAMRFHVFRYLSKPIDKMRLFRNMEDALNLYYSRTTDILVETREENIKVPLNDLICVEAIGKEVHIHTTTADYVSVHPMKFWLQKISHPHFYQTHRSFLINLKYVKSFDKTVIRLNCIDVNAYLTRRKYTDFKRTYLRYLENVR